MSPLVWRSSSPHTLTSFFHGKSLCIGLMLVVNVVVDKGMQKVTYATAQLSHSRVTQMHQPIFNGSLVCWSKWSQISLSSFSLWFRSLCSGQGHVNHQECLNVVARTGYKCASLCDGCPGYSSSFLSCRRARNNHGTIWAARFNHIFHCSASSVDSVHIYLQRDTPFSSLYPPLGWEYLLLVSKEAPHIPQPWDSCFFSSPKSLSILIPYWLLSFCQGRASNLSQHSHAKNRWQDSVDSRKMVYFS